MKVLFNFLIKNCILKIKFNNLMSKSMTLGIVRSLSSKYVEIKRNLNSNPKRISLNDSGSLINDNGKIK